MTNAEHDRLEVRKSAAITVLNLTVNILKQDFTNQMLRHHLRQLGYPNVETPQDVNETVLEAVHLFKRLSEQTATRPGACTTPSERQALTVFRRYAAWRATANGAHLSATFSGLPSSEGEEVEEPLGRLVAGWQFIRQQQNMFDATMSATGQLLLLDDLNDGNDA